MKNNSRQKFRVKGIREFAFVTKTFSVRKTQRQQVEKTAGNEYQAKLNGASFSGEIVQKKQNGYSVMVNGNTYHFLIEKEESLKRRNKNGSSVVNEQMISLKAPMPGKICEIFVSKGAEVKEGEPLLILEAMKMQNQILAPKQAKVVDVRARKNENVLGDQVLLEMEMLTAQHEK